MKPGMCGKRKGNYKHHQRPKEKNVNQEQDWGKKRNKDTML